MCHLGFQQLYEQQSVQGLESPRQTVSRLVEEHKGTIDKVTVVGHSLGAGETFSETSAYVSLSGWDWQATMVAFNLTRVSITGTAMY